MSRGHSRAQKKLRRRRCLADACMRHCDDAVIFGVPQPVPRFGRLTRQDFEEAIRLLSDPREIDRRIRASLHAKAILDATMFARYERKYGRRR